MEETEHQGRQSPTQGAFVDTAPIAHVQNGSISCVTVDEEETVVANGQIEAHESKTSKEQQETEKSNSSLQAIRRKLSLAGLTDEVSAVMVIYFNGSVNDR